MLDETKLKARFMYYAYLIADVTVEVTSSYLLADLTDLTLL